MRIAILAGLLLLTPVAHAGELNIGVGESVDNSATNDRDTAWTVEYRRVFRDRQIVDQRSCRDRDTHHVRGVHRHAPVIEAEVLDQLQLLAFAQHVTRQVFLVDDEKIGIRDV